MPKKWLGKAEFCDLCRQSLQDGDFFVDGRTSFGSWALLCPACFEKHGSGLGTGKGQKYDSKTFEKLEG